MNLLAFETATLHLSVALYSDGALIERGERVAQGGAEFLLPWASQLLSEAGLTLNQLDGIAFGSGPGGFTGLRLACGVAQGLACGLDLPLIGVHSLEAMAQEVATGLPEGTSIFSCLDARMEEVYFAAYRLVYGKLEECIPPSVAPPTLISELPGHADGESWLGCGDGFAIYPEILPERLKRMTRVLPAIYPTARAVAQLAVPRLQTGSGHDASHAVPLYVRNKVALTTTERLARGGLK